MKNKNTIQIIEINNKSHYFQNEITKSLIMCDKEYFKKAYKDYKNFISQPEYGLNKSKIAIKAASEISSILMNFTNNPVFNDNNCLKYYNVISDLISPEIFTFIFWIQNKKNCCIQMFNNYQVDLTGKEYDSLTLVLLPHSLNRNVPQAIDKKLEYLTMQKREYFSYQEKYKLADELTSLLLENKKTPKKPKI